MTRRAKPRIESESICHPFRTLGQLLGRKGAQSNADLESSGDIIISGNRPAPSASAQASPKGIPQSEGAGASKFVMVRAIKMHNAPRSKSCKAHVAGMAAACRVIVCDGWTLQHDNDAVDRSRPVVRDSKDVP